MFSLVLLDFGIPFLPILFFKTANSEGPDVDDFYSVL